MRVSRRKDERWRRAREGVERGAGEILLTSMDRDGTTDGDDLALTRAVSEAVGVPVIASGGAGTLEHLAAALHAGADAEDVLAEALFSIGIVVDDRPEPHLRGRLADPARGPGVRHPC